MKLKVSPFKVKRSIEPYLFLLPALVALIIIYLYPMLRVFYLGFFDFDLLERTFEFVGIGNYLEILRSEVFLGALCRTFIWTGGSVAGQLLGGLGFALLLNQKFRGNSFVRTIILIPWMTSGVVIGLNWRWILNDQYGVLNDVFARLGLPALMWLANPRLAMVSVVAVNIWKAIPLTTVMILAGLSAIPLELYEAATIDGADWWKKFRYITLPSLRYLLLILLLLTTIWTMVFFDLIFIMTEGGPGEATEILPLFVYRYSFKNFQFGLGASAAILLALINGVFVLFYLKILGKTG